METIEQLRQMRDAARRRVESMPDYKLMTKLSTLITELEEMFGAASGAGSGEDPADEDSGEEEPEARSPRAGQPAPPSASAAEPEPGPAPRPAPEVDAPENWEPFDVAEAGMEAETLREAEMIPEVLPAYDAEPVEYAPQDELPPVADEELLPEDEPEAATAVDTDIAISQAMAELEADLGAELEPAPRNRFRYGNST